MEDTTHIPDIFQLLEWINRIYDGEILTYQQYRYIAMYFCGNGLIDEKYEVWASASRESLLSLEEKTFKGAYYLGIFVRFLEGDRFVFSYTDVRDIKGDINLLVCPDGNVHVVSCIEGDIDINTFNK